MPAPPVIAGRYEVVAPIGAGASATVYAVVDRKSGERRALKLLRPRGLDDPASLVRAFHREFSLLTELRHPHLVAVHDFGVAAPPGEEAAEELPFFTMDLVEGRPVAEALPAPPDWSALARVADAVLDALEALHQRGLVHRDVTAGNILVGKPLEAEPPPVWLMDLGLVDRAREAEAGVVRGTLATVAPETLRGGRVDGRADLYSLGCVLFRLATGRDPFTGASPWELLRAHARRSPPNPADLAPEIPGSFAGLILRLLAKRPDERPPSARAVRDELAPLSGRRPGRTPPPARPLAPAFCGRERELARFESALGALREGRGDAWLISGATGSGRSRLLEELRLAARLAGVDALLVRTEEAPRRPLGLAAHCATLADPRDPDRSLEAIAARRTEPLVLLVDDLDRADAASRERLGRVALGARAGLPLLFVATATPGEADRESAAVWGARIVLEPLDPSASARMAASILGRPELPERWATALATATGGLPLVIEETVAALVREGRVTADLGGDPGALLRSAARQAARSRAWLEEHWKALGPAGRGGLTALAIAGEPLAVADLEALDPRTAKSPEQLDLLIERGLVRRIARDGGSVAFKLEAPALAAEIVSMAPRATVRAIRRRWAERLEDRPGAAGARAELWLAAGDTAAARPLLLEAAGEALRHGAPLEALRYADLWLEAAGEVSAAEEAPVRHLRARALASAGRPALAFEEFRRAIDAARSSGDAARLAAVLRSAGAFEGRRGDPDAGLTRLEESLALFDELGATDEGAHTLLEIADLLMRKGQTGEARRRLESALGQARRAGAPELEARALVGLGRIALAAGNEAVAIDLFREAEAVPCQPDVRGAALRGRLLALTTAGEAEEALALARDLLAEAGRSGDLDAQAAFRTELGRALGAAGRRTEAVHELAEAEAIRERLGDEGERQAVAALRARLLFELGRLRAAEDLAEKVARAAGSGEAAAAAERVLRRIRVFLGRPAPPRGGEPESGERRLEAAWAALGAGDLEGARAAFQETLFLARREGHRALESDALVGLAECCLAGRDDDRLRMAIRRLQRAARDRKDRELRATVRLLSAERELQRPDGDLPKARDEAREAAETLEGAERADLAWRAWGLLAAAAARLGEEDLAADAARRGRRALDALAANLAAEDRARLLDRPRARKLSEIGQSPAAAAVPAERAAGHRVEVLERLLEINRALNSTLELDEQLRTLLDTAVELTGAERGFVLLDQGGEATLELARGAGGEDLAGTDRELSRSVARRTMKDGRPLLAHDALSDVRLARFASVHALKLRSVLAMPLAVRGEIAGAIVLDSRSASALFDAEHVRLLSRLADQAGLAIGNARLVAELRRQADEIRRLNERLTQQVEEQRVELLEKQSNLEIRFRYDCIVGASPAMQKVYRSLDKITPTEIPVLITGESGTGKDLVARVLHYNGPRAKHRFVTVNCAALTDTLLESELFGHRRGAFTGAERDRKGLFEQADGGTLFLDEIGEMPLPLQPKLLRAIQFGEVRRVGEDTPRQVDVRIVAATNRDPAVMVREGRFREDLFYRLDVGRIHLAPLRERLEDIGLLVEHFLEEQARKEGARPRTIEPAALKLFLRYGWPGNVRELENEVTRLAAFTEGEVITEVDVLENALFLERAQERPAAAPVGTLEQTELEQIRQALAASGGNRTRAAEMLGIDRSTLYRKIRKYGEQLGRN